MVRLGNRHRHYWLLQRMARQTGVDLAAASAAGRLNAQEWAAMVTACRGCDWSRGCEAWLRRGSRREGATPAVAPEPCRNRRRLALLRLEEELGR